ncbi:hypothetical protein D910_12227, partial [Dendroctonus ponderosae]
MDVYLWDRIKDFAYATPLTTKEECTIAMVRNAFNSLSPKEIQRATNGAVTRRVQQCLASNGQHFEHLFSVDINLPGKHRYFDRRQPSLKALKRLYHNLGSYGCFTQPRNEDKVINEAVEVNVLAIVSQNPQVSTREIAAEKMRVLKKYKFYPINYQYLKLCIQGIKSCVSFCTGFRNKCQQDIQFSYKILRTNKTRFKICGMFNRHNEHIWNQTHPHHVEQRRPQIKFGFNVWCGIVGSKILGPFTFQCTLNGGRYLQFLRNNLDSMLDDLDLKTWRNVQWFQHDGAPPHNFFQGRNHLDVTFPGGWIGRNGLILWLPRLPDLPSLDFFLGEPYQTQFTKTNVPIQINSKNL